MQHTDSVPDGLDPSAWKIVKSVPGTTYGNALVLIQRHRRDLVKAVTQLAAERRLELTTLTLPYDPATSAFHALDTIDWDDLRRTQAADPLAPH
jgi:hypothetical protein